MEFDPMDITTTADEGPARIATVETLRDTASKAILVLLWCHVVIAPAIAVALGIGWLAPTLVMVLLAAVSTASWRFTGSGVQTRCTVAVALMGGVSVLVYEMSGHPWQPDMHMYFFATLAFLAAYCDFRPIVYATVAVVLHHLILNFLFPAAVYPGNSDLGRVMLHATILAVAGAILVWLGIQLSGMFELMAVKTAEAEAAKAEQQKISAERVESDRKAKQDRDAARRELAASF